MEKRKAEQLEKYERYARRAWNMPIVFYGKVVDEKGKSVEGALIQFGWTDLSPSGTSDLRTLSDGAGIFSLEGARGKNLGVRVEKEGYYGSDRNRLNFEYADPGPSFHVPDRANPVIFHLRKMSATERLIRQDALYGLDYDQNLYYYNLQTGVITRKPPSDVSATLKISVTRSVSGRGEPFDWTLTMEALNGGLQETSEEFPFLAPEDGYAKVWSASQSKAGSLFKQYPKANLHFRTNDGRYALIDLELRNLSTREIGADIIVNSYLNPSGSRNLEYESR